ncbi:MAG TPA: hypothetical protein VIW03_06190, partial [Anaeromyxobacter sp.]
PGRPLDLPGLLEVKSRGEAMAARVAREGAGAVPWGTCEKFRPVAADEVPEGSHAPLEERP